MAYVSRLERSQRSTFKVQPSQVVCQYAVFGHNEGRRVLQLDTSGSETREVPGKVSQTLQFGPEQARILYDLIAREFGFK